MNEIGKRIEQVRRRLDMSMEEFGNRIGISRASVSRLERGINHPAQRTIMLIAEKFGISERWLRNGTGEMLKAVPNTDDLVSTLAAEYSLTENDMLILRAFLALSESDRQAFLRFGKELAQLQDSEEPPQQPWADVIPTTLLKTRYFARPSAGPGNDIFDGQEEVEVVDTPQARQADFVLQISGNSMEPMYKDGDQVLIQSGTDVDPGQIGVWLVDGNVYIKQRLEHGLHSLNPEYPDVPLNKNSDIHCYGRVIGKAEVI